MTNDFDKLKELILEVTELSRNNSEVLKNLNSKIEINNECHEIIKNMDESITLLTRLNEEVVRILSFLSLFKERNQ